MNGIAKTQPSQDVMLVLCNCPSVAVAEDLAGGLIQHRLAACVNVFSPLHSWYRWQDKVEVQTEVPLLSKTTRRAYPALQAWLKEHHPYEVPEILAWPACFALPAYAEWVLDAVANPNH